MSSGKIALVMGVANTRSIAWSCVETFVRHGWRVILTCENEKTLSRAQPLWQKDENVLGGFECNVQNDLDDSSGTSLFQERLKDMLKDDPLSAVVHSFAFGPNIKTTPLLQSTKADFLQTQEISAYSLIQVARQTDKFWTQIEVDGSSCKSGSITALSYLGAVRAVPGYHAMGPAKASLESITRGLALEMAQRSDQDVASRIRVNAVSAGPLPTLSAKGGLAGFDNMRKDMERRAPLGNVTADQVSSTVHFLSGDGASGITGQTVYVDGGYSIVGGPGTQDLDLD